GRCCHRWDAPASHPYRPWRVFRPGFRTGDTRPDRDSHSLPASAHRRDFRRQEPEVSRTGRQGPGGAAWDGQDALPAKGKECDPGRNKETNKVSPGMDRRTAIAVSLAGLSAAAFPRQAWADTVVPGEGVLPTDPTENITLWPGMPPGGAGLKLPPI